MSRRAETSATVLAGGLTRAPGGGAGAASRAALRDAGLRVTPQRLAVLEALANADGDHLSADDLWQQLPAGASMDRSTAYRVLADLSDVGLLTQVRFSDGISRFEVQSRAHHHAACRRCGATEDLPAALIKPLAAAVRRRTGFVVAADEPLLVRGTCAVCAAAPDPEATTGS